MRRLLDLRIVRWELKLLYAIGVWAIGFPLGALLTAVSIPVFLGNVLLSVVTIAGMLLGARIFRGKGEAIEPARPWWRMTARPTLSRRVGIAFTIGAVLALIFAILKAFGVGIGQGLTLLDWIDVLLFYGALAYWYLNSAVRLKKAGVTALEPEVKFKPKTKLS